MESERESAGRAGERGRIRCMHASIHAVEGDLGDMALKAGSAKRRASKERERERERKRKSKGL